MRSVGLLFLFIFTASVANVCALYCDFSVQNKKVSVSSCHAKKNIPVLVKSKISIQPMKRCIEKDEHISLFESQVSFKPILVSKDRIEEFSLVSSKHLNFNFAKVSPNLFKKLPLYLSKKVIRV